MPRSLKLAGKWKASELRSFLLYYSIYVLRDILPTNYLKHWLLLVDAIFTLLLEKLTVQDITKSEQMLHKFITDTVLLYGVEHISYNIHQLSHLGECVKVSGPLWRTSAFPFESNNQQILQMFSGTVFIPKQIANKFLRLNSIPKLTKIAVEGDAVTKLLIENIVGKWLAGYPLTNSAIYVDENVIALGASFTRKYSDIELALIRSFDQSCSDICIVYQRVLMHGFIIQLKNGSIATISSFVLDLNRHNMYILCKLYVTSDKPFLKTSSVINNHHYIVSPADTIIAVVPNEIISKVVFLGKLKTENYLIATQPNAYECD
jgi:hypothetical protein